MFYLELLVYKIRSIAKPFKANSIEKKRFDKTSMKCQSQSLYNEWNLLLWIEDLPIETTIDEDVVSFINVHFSLTCDVIEGVPLCKK